MKWHSYFPKNNEDSIEWMINFRSKLEVHAATLKLDPEEVTEIRAAVDECIEAGEKYFSLKATLRAAKENFLGKLKYLTRREGILSRFIKTIKGRKTYTQGIGEDLGIVGHAIHIDYDTYIPDMKVVILGYNKVELRFNKHYCDSAAIYSRRGEEDRFSLIGMSTGKVFYDVRPNINAGTPEERYYQIVLIRNDKEVSQPSDVACIKV